MKASMTLKGIATVCAAATLLFTLLVGSNTVAIPFNVIDVFML